MIGSFNNQNHDGNGNEYGLNKVRYKEKYKTLISGRDLVSP